jgi:archaellum component FlaC
MIYKKKWRCDDTQVRICTDVLDDPQNDIRMQVYVKGNDEHINDSLVSIEHIAQEIKGLVN